MCLIFFFVFDSYYLQIGYVTTCIIFLIGYVYTCTYLLDNVIVVNFFFFFFFDRMKMIYLMIYSVRLLT